MKSDPPSGSQVPPPPSPSKHKLRGRGEGPSGLGWFPTLQGRRGLQPIELIEKLPRAEKEQAYATGGWFTGGPTRTSTTCSSKARRRAQHPKDRGSSARRAHVPCNLPATPEGGRMPALQVTKGLPQGPHLKAMGPGHCIAWLPLQYVFPGFHSLTCHGDTPPPPSPDKHNSKASTEWTPASEARWRPSA